MTSTNDRFDDDPQPALPTGARAPADVEPAGVAPAGADAPPHKPVVVGCVFAAVGVRVAERSPAEYAACLEEL